MRLDDRSALSLRLIDEQGVADLLRLLELHASVGPTGTATAA